MESSTPQSSIVSSVGVVEKNRTVKAAGRRPWRIKQSKVLGASERSGPRESRLQMGVDGGLGAQESIARGSEQPLLRGLAEGA